MADFIGTILTNAGRDILTKALAGAKLTFSRIGIGDGVWDSGTNPEQMVALKDEKKSLPIQEISVVGDGTTRLRFVLTNSGLTEGFFVREIGIFALDPDTQEEKLYAVAYAENPDFIPSDGVTKVENVVDIYTVVSTAQSVTAVISDTVVLATKEDIEQHNTDPDAHPSLLQAVSNSAKADLSNITGLGNLLNLDGSGSGLDADLIRGLPADFTSNKATNGYTKLPNGLIIQWGYISMSSSQGSNGMKTVYFPLTFPNALYLLIIGPPESTDAVSSGYVYYSEYSDKSSFDFEYEDAYGAYVYHKWLAIGY